MKMSCERGEIENPYWIVPGDFRGASRTAVRDQDFDDRLSSESESSCESLSSSESNSSSVSRTSSIEAANPVGGHQVAEVDDHGGSHSSPHPEGAVNAVHLHATGVDASAIISTPHESTRGGGEQKQWQLHKDQQQELLHGLYPPAGKTSHIEHSTSASSDASCGPTQSQAFSSWVYAECTPVNLSRFPSGGTGQAICSDTDGVLILLALDHRGLCLLRISAPQAPAHPTEVDEMETSQGLSFCDSRELLAIGGELPFIRRLQGEATLVQIGSETLLLISKPPDAARGQPARLAVHPLSRAMRKYAARMGKNGERFHSLGFDELPSWPSGSDEPAPEPRSFYGVVVDHARQAVLLFGGAGSVEEEKESESRAQNTTDKDSSAPKWHPLDDLWSFSMSSCAWVQHRRNSRQHSATSAGVEAHSDLHSPTSWPKAVAGHSMTAWHGDIWMFGGYTRPACVDVGPPGEAAPINDLWCLNPESGLWRPVPSSGPSPPPRYLHVACIASGCLLLFGGLGAHGPAATEDTMYAADLSARTTAAWARVNIDSASLPPPDYYLGAAPTLGAKATSGAADLIIYGGRSAYVITARLHAGAVHSPSLEASTYDDEAPSIADRPLVLYGEVAEAPGYTQDAEDFAECRAQPTLPEVKDHYATEEGIYREAEASDEHREVCDHTVSRGMQILATLMPGADRQGPETGLVKSGAAWGLLPHVRSASEAPCAARVGGWQPAFPIQSPAAPIIFRARRRGRRHTNSASLEASEKTQEHVFDLGSNLPSNTSGVQPFFPPQAASQPAEATVAQQQAADLSGPEIYACERAGRPALPPAVRPAAATAQPSAPPAPDSLHEAQRPLSQRQISILLSLSHQATVGAAGPGGSGAFAPRSSPAQAAGWHSEPLNGPRSNPPLTALPASLSLCNSSLYASPVVGCTRTSDLSNTRGQRSQSSSSTTGGLEIMSPHAKGRRSSMASQASTKISREDGAEAALRPKLCRLGSVASRQPPPSRLDSSLPLNRGSPQSPQGGVEALMRWMDSALETHPSCSTSMSESHVSPPPGSPNQGRNISGRGDFMSAWAAGSEVSPHDINGDAAYVEKQSSMTLERLPVVPWFDSSQDQARSLARRVYSAQFTNELPQRKASFERKALPPLPIKSEMLAQSAGASRSEPMVARRMSQLAFTAEPNDGKANGELPLPRPARRLKPFASKTRKSGCTLKPKENAKGAPSKARPADAKPTPPLAQARQVYREARPPASFPRPGRTKSTSQGISAAAYDRPVSISGRRKVNRRDGGEHVLGSTLRRSSSRKTSLPSFVTDEHQPMHARLLRRMTGWPAEAIAAFLLAKSTTSSQRNSKSRSSSATAKPKNARKRKIPKRRLLKRFRHLGLRPQPGAADPSGFGALLVKTPGEGKYAENRIFRK
ncbi:hypothetical protein Emag_001925 [Eimeria magna]